MVPVCSMFYINPDESMRLIWTKNTNLITNSLGTDIIAIISLGS